jgi:competence protein ComEC
LVAAFAWFVLRRLGTGPRWTDLTAAAVIGAYVAMVGDLHSLRRAFVMALALVVARAVQRPGDLMRSLGCALFVLLALRPASLHSVGFQLSFVATAAVIVALRVTPRMNRRGRRRYLAGAATTALAGAFVLFASAPLQVHYFGRLTLTGPVATVVFLPAVAAVLAGSATACLLEPVPVVGDAAFTVLASVVRVLQWMVGRAAAVVPPDVPLPAGVVVVAGLVVFVGLVLRRRFGGGAAIAAVLTVTAPLAKNCGL